MGFLRCVGGRSVSPGPLLAARRNQGDHDGRAPCASPKREARCSQNTGDASRKGASHMILSKGSCMDTLLDVLEQSFTVGNGELSATIPTSAALVAGARFKGAFAQQKLLLSKRIMRRLVQSAKRSRKHCSSMCRAGTVTQTVAATPKLASPLSIICPTRWWRRSVPCKSAHPFHGHCNIRSGLR